MRLRFSLLQSERFFKIAAHGGAAASVLSALAALFYAPQLLGLRTFPDGDFMHHFLPFNLFQYRELWAGRLPIWNPYTYAGHPFLADVQAAVFYPLNNLMLLLTLPFGEAGARLYFLQVEAVLHVALGGFFVYLLVRSLTRHPLAALLSGGIFAFSGYLTGYPPLQLAILRTAIWLPLLLWLGLYAVERGAWRWWIGLGATLAIALLAGHPQTFLHIGYAVAAWLMFLWLYKNVGQISTTAGPPTSRWQAWIRLWGQLGLALGVMLGLSAAQLLPSLEFSQLSVRANVDYAYVSAGLPLRDTWQLLLPGLFTQFSPLYVGVIALGLAVCAWGVNRNIPRTEGQPSQFSLALFFGLLGLVALLLSYGDNGFLYPVFYKVAPGWNLFRGQERAAYLVALSLSVLSGIGAAALATMPLARRRLLALSFCGATIGGVYAAGLLYQLNGATAISEWRYVAIAFVSLLLVSIFGLLLWLPGWSMGRLNGLLVLTMLNLFWANFGTNVSDFGPMRKTILAPEMETLQAAVDAQPAGDSLPARVYNESRLYEDYGMRQQIEDVWGSSPLRLTRYAALFDEFPLDRMWRLLGVEYVVSWRRELFGPSQLLAEFPQVQDTTFVHRLAQPNPRAWVVHQLQYASDAAAQRLLADHDFDLENVAVLPADLAPAGQTTLVELGRAGQSSVQIERLTPSRLRINVESESAGLLVVSENWMPGWQISNRLCTMTGDECWPSINPMPSALLAPPQRANLTLLGIHIAPGATQFELSYRPSSIRFGLGISSITLFVLLVMAVKLLTSRYRANSDGNQ